MAEPDWSRWLRPGDHLVGSHMSAEPAALLASMARCPDLPSPLHLMLGVPFSSAAAALPERCSLTTYGGMGSAGSLARARAIQISPLPYSRSEVVYRQDRDRWPCDVALVALGRRPDGQLHMAPSHGPVLEAARRARHVIAQVGQQVPFVHGALWPQDLSPAAILETSDGAWPLSEGAPGPLEQAIAAQVASLVPDGACLQVGIGTLPSAVLAALHAHRHLGVHTGMLSDGMWRLMEAGAIDHSRKSLDAGLAVTGSVCGSPELYAAVDGHPQIVLREPGYTHSPSVIVAQSRMFCLNSALEVDLLGHANAETVSTPEGRWRWVGGVGGLLDFMRAAVLAPGGQAVLALASRTAQSKPRIVARLSGPATVSASDADLVVTEHGIAHLRDQGVSQRVRRMIAIAHPEDRDSLAGQARSLGLL